MHAMLQKNIDTGFITEEQGKYIEEAINNGESLIVSGHRSAGVRGFMAACMAIAKGQYDSVQVKNEDAIDKDAKYYLIPGQEGIDFEALVQKAFNKPNAAFVTLKEPELPYSIMKIMKKGFKETGDASKVVTLLECRKIDDVPYMINLTRTYYDEKGKILKEDIERVFE
ncbi:MAG: hypothetical protein Q4G61_04635 [Tissierellia bacterium]|nr:hypothetical protein [Tissierellia bacterium]